MAETGVPSVRSAMPVLALNEGVWEGTYRSVTSRIVLLRQWDFRIEIALSDDPQAAYRQQTTYTYPDGAVRRLEFTAQFDGTRIHWANERSGADGSDALCQRSRGGGRRAHGRRCIAQPH